MQEELGAKEVEATSGGGMVTVRASGHQDILSVKINPEVVDPEDVEMARVQEELGAKEVEATSGGGMVTVRASGHQDILSVKINPEVVDPEDVDWKTSCWRQFSRRVKKQRTWQRRKWRKPQRVLFRPA